MPKTGFQRNARTVAKILKSDANAIAFQHAIAEQVLENVDDPEAFITEYVTDRHVVAVMVPADKQAKHGLGTKAASAAGLSPG